MNKIQFHRIIDPDDYYEYWVGEAVWLKLTELQTENERLTKALQDCQERSDARWAAITQILSEKNI